MLKPLDSGLRRNDVRGYVTIWNTTGRGPGIELDFLHHSRHQNGVIRRSSMIELKSRKHTVDDLGSAIELCYANGWTDGLPVIPPTV